MSSVRILHPGDTFVIVYDALDSRRIETRELRAWADDQGVRLLADSTAEQIFTTGGVPEPLLDDRSPKSLYAILVGIDQAFWFANPFREDVDHGALGYLRRLLIESHRYNSGTSGALLPRRVYPTTPQTGPSTLAQHFDLVRVPACMWDRVAPNTLLDKLVDFDATMLHRDLKVGQIPFLAEPDDLVVQCHSEGNSRYYRAGLRPQCKWRDRVTTALDEADRCDADLVVLPELALDPDLLTLWQNVIHSKPPQDTPLRWILLGSGPTSSNGADGAQPANRAALVDRRTGEILLSQDKQKPFNISEQTMTEWNLNSIRSWELKTGSGTHDEWIREGTFLSIVESEIGRLAILICEDLADVTDLGALARAVGVSQVLVPIWAPPINRWHWEEQSSRVLMNHTGCTTIVCNGLSLGRRSREEFADPVDPDPAVTLLVLAARGGVQAKTAPPDIGKSSDAVMDSITPRVAVWPTPTASAPHLRRSAGPTTT